jgi:hypothetical protein
MRYGVAILITALMLLAGSTVGGAGHGWVAGAFGCFALAPLSFLAVANGLSRTPSFQGALAILTVGVALCIGVTIATVLEGNQYFMHYIQATGRVGLLVAGSAYVGWLLIAAFAVFRTRRVLRHGT